MQKVFIKEIINQDIETELQQIGFDENYRHIASDKFKYKNFKIYNLSSAQANIVKQTALSIGADCATNKEVIRGNIELSNAILGGSVSQIKKISEKLKNQPFNLGEIGEEIYTQTVKKRAVKTKLAGILNITPDSFSDGGKYLNPKDAQEHLIQMIEDGADIIDIGAESTRPGASEIKPNEQIERLKPILTFIQKENIKTPISIDTRSSVVAEYVLDNGVSIINDTSGFNYDRKIADVIAKYHSGVILQHTKGIPENMQDKPFYINVVEEVYLSLKNKIEYARNLGIENIIIDPGIGFGKTKENNFEILKRIEEFYSLDHPVMIGISRKSLLGINNDDNDLKDSLSLALSCPLIQKGVDYLRVHNVKLHRTLLNTLTS